MTVGNPVCVAPMGDHCGEGPLWHPEEHALYWTDVNRFLIHRYDPSNGSVKWWFFDEPVCLLTLTNREDTIAVVLGSGILLWKPRTDERRAHGFRLEGWPEVRLNDGGVDPRGSLWVGSMQNNVGPNGEPGKCERPEGRLFRINPGGAVSVWKSAIGISNTFAWSPDRTKFCFADTRRNTIWVYDYDESTGAISAERPFFTGFARGEPDGSAMDSEGYLWNCRHGGSCVARVAPDGSVDRVIEMPVVNVTGCAFGDEDRRTLYIASAGIGAPPGDRLAGSLFAVSTPVAGLPCNRFRI